MERPNIPPSSTERLFLSTSNYIFTVVFTTEMFIKVCINNVAFENLKTEIKKLRCKDNGRCISAMDVSSSDVIALYFSVIAYEQDLIT